jgi:hypothetical protein
MPSESSSVDFLRELALRQGIRPEDADLEGVRGFLDTILPSLAELEALIPEETALATPSPTEPPRDGIHPVPHVTQ